MKILGKWSEIFGKTSKTSLSVFLFNEQNIAWVLVDMESLLVFNLISHSFPAKKKNDTNVLTNYDCAVFVTMIVVFTITAEIHARSLANFIVNMRTDT